MSAASRRQSEAPLPRPSGSTTSGSSPSSARADLAVRGRRGPLHLRVGAGLPSRLPQAGRAVARAGAERVLALTATATPAVVETSAGLGIAAEERRHRLLSAQPDAADDAGPAGEREQLLIDRLRERPAGSTIVYVTLQRTALRVAALLAAAGLPARPYHAGMSAEDRVATQEWWTASTGNIVVATIAFGMGIDKADVRYVYHSTCRRGSSRTRRRSAGPAATASRRSASSTPARTTSPRSRTSCSATLRRPRRSPGCSTSVFANESGTQFAVSDTSSRAGSTSGRSC